MDDPVVIDTNRRGDKCNSGLSVVPKGTIRVALNGEDSAIVNAFKKLGVITSFGVMHVKSKVRQGI